MVSGRGRRLRRMRDRRIRGNDPRGRGVRLACGRRESRRTDGCV